MDNKIIVLIPARYASTRFPAKMLKDLGGKPLIVRTAEQAQKSAFSVAVAYDDERIGTVLKEHNIPAFLTASTHQNGSERLAEVVRLENYPDETIIVNVQGDEPLLPPELIQKVAEALWNNPEAQVATLATPTREANNPNIVKVVLNGRSEALYFSRSAIPYDRDGAGAEYLRHIGIYAYRANILRAYPHWSATPLEQLEKLEQLRFLEYGVKIAVAVVADAPPHGVDTEADYLAIKQFFTQEG